MPSSVCGCTVISARGRSNVLDLILADRYFRLTHEGDIVVGTKLFDERDVDVLLDLYGASRSKSDVKSVFQEVSTHCDELGLLPDGLDIKLLTHAWHSADDSGVTYEIVYAAVKP